MGTQIDLIAVIIVGLVSAPFIILLCYLIHKAVQLVNRDETTRD
jgi:hypothetical protein